MSHPVVPIEGVGETISKALGGISQTLQQVDEQKRQQQADALRALVAQSQLQTEAVGREHTQAQTVTERARLADEQRKQREMQQDEEEYQRAMGPVLLAFTQGNGDINSDTFKQAVGRSISSIKRPGAGSLFHTRLNQFVQDYTAAPEAASKLQEQVARGQKAVTDAGVAAAEAHSKTAAARALDAWYDAHPNTPLEVGLTQLRESLARERETATADRQAEIAQRQSVIGALNAARTAKRADDAMQYNPAKRRPLSGYIGDQAVALGMQPQELITQARRLTQNMPDIPAPSGNRARDLVTARQLRSRLRRAGLDDQGARAAMEAQGWK